MHRKSTAWSRQEQVVTVLRRSGLDNDSHYACKYAELEGYIKNPVSQVELMGYKTRITLQGGWNPAETPYWARRT